MKKQNGGKYDKFYTNEKLAKRLINKVHINNFDLIIEPSAGSGSFSKNIPNCLAYDIKPCSDGIIKEDFLKVNIQTNIPKSKILIIGNPPFGRQSSLAFKFLKKSCKIADTVAFILPKSFRKQSYKDKVPLSHSCVYEEILEPDSFLVEEKEYDVPTVFQIWKKTEVPRKKQKRLSTEDFTFCKKNEHPDICFRRVGWNAGLVSTDTNVNVNSFYFIKIKNDSVQKILNDIDWTDVFENTVGSRSISKNEIISKYIEKLKNS